jgi:hypothetical protein
VQGEVVVTVRFSVRSYIQCVGKKGERGAASRWFKALRELGFELERNRSGRIGEQGQPSAFEERKAWHMNGPNNNNKCLPMNAKFEIMSGVVKMP